MSESLTFQKNTKYSFTMESEFKNSIKLCHDEKILHRYKLRCFGPLNFARIGYFVLTNKRMVLIKHYAFRPDILISVDYNDIHCLELRETSIFNRFFPFRAVKYIVISFAQNQEIKIFQYSMISGMRWLPSNRKTELLFNTVSRVMKLR